MAFEHWQLEMAERHIRDAERHIAQQKDIIKRLSQGPPDLLLKAEMLLTELESLLRDHHKNRDLISKALAESRLSPPGPITSRRR
jgi:hypothetical protein